MEKNKKLKRLQDKITELEDTIQKMKVVFEHSFDAIYVTDGQGETLIASQSLNRISKLDPKNVVGRNMNDLVEQGLFDSSVTLEVLRKKETVTMYQRAANGKMCISTGCPVFDSEGNIYRVVTNVRATEEINKLVEELEVSKKLNEHFRSQLSSLNIEQMKQEKVIASSKNMLNVIDLAFKVAQSDATVLILGESGVGKEVLSNLIHRHWKRDKQGAMIKINCSAIPRELLESELFGYAPGAFSGANKLGKPGIFELADQGTLFLDEIAELPMELQAKLLRVLQEQEFTRIGGTTPKKVKARIIASTNKDLEKMVGKRLFREDLYYRLHVLPINIPPLRERQDDIPLLTRFFLEKFNQKYKVRKKISHKTMQIMMAYHWPGNIRELKNLIERLTVTVDSALIRPEYLPYRMHLTNLPAQAPFKPLKKIMHEVERKIILAAMESHGNTIDAARSLGISQPTMSRKLKKYRKR